MILLSKMAEEALKIILDCNKKDSDYEVSGQYVFFPPYMKLSYNQIFEEIKSVGLISNYMLMLNGWNVYLTPEASKYFDRKGMRIELFNELPDNARELLNDLIRAENDGDNIVFLLNNRMESDKTNCLQRDMIAELQDNALLNVIWAENQPCHASLTNAGRTYFEREDRYLDRLNRNSAPNISIGTINANGSNLVFGNAINSSLNINDSIKEIERKIISDGGEDVEDLQEILGEVKEILENFEYSKIIQPRKGFMKRLSAHIDKHGWFYGSVVTLLGEVGIKLLMGK